MNGPYINPVTKGFDLINGNIVNQNVLLSLFYMRLSCPLGSYINDITFGNPLITNKFFPGQLNKGVCERDILSCLSDMVTLGYINQLIVVCTSLTLNRAEFSITATDNLDNQLHFPWGLDL